MRHHGPDLRPQCTKCGSLESTTVEHCFQPIRKCTNCGHEDEIAKRAAEDTLNKTFTLKQNEERPTF